MPEPISIPTPKSAIPVVGPVEPKTENPDPEPVSKQAVCRDTIQAKLNKLEKDMDKLMESRQRILAQIGPKLLRQLNQVNSLIEVTKVRIAEVRDILG